MLGKKLRFKDKTCQRFRIISSLDKRYQQSEPFDLALITSETLRNIRQRVLQNIDKIPIGV